MYEQTTNQSTNHMKHIHVQIKYTHLLFHIAVIQRLSKCIKSFPQTFIVDEQHILDRKPDYIGLYLSICVVIK